jgi:hypothetical protein
MTIPASAISLPPKNAPDRYEGVADAEGFGRLASRPNAIDPNAVTFFKQWIVGCVEIDPTGKVVLKPEFTPIGSRPIAATSLGGSGLKLEKTDGDGQSGPPGGIVGPIQVEVVTGASGDPVAGVAVVFRVKKGFGASIGGQPTASRITDVNGEAEIDDWRLGIIPGPNQLEVAVAGATVTFAATAT